MTTPSLVAEKLFNEAPTGLKPSSKLDLEWPDTSRLDLDTLLQGVEPEKNMDKLILERASKRKKLGDIGGEGTFSSAERHF